MYQSRRDRDRTVLYGRQMGMINAANMPEHQKVSSVPDIIVQNRNRELDEFITIACDGIWDVQTNHECAAMISDIFQEGESDIGLLCEEVNVISSSDDHFYIDMIAHPTSHSTFECIMKLCSHILTFFRYKILDTCLIKKSKDNMTAMVIKMAAQTIGSGEGVIQRRRLREQERKANQEENVEQY